MIFSRLRKRSRLCSRRRRIGSHGATALDVLQGVINWNSTLGAWLPGYMFDLSGSYQSALVLNVLTAWIAIGVILWISEW